MAKKPIKTPLPADLPENWNAGQIVAPDGPSVGLTEQHGYNYLMAAVNRAQQGVNEVNDAFEAVGGKRACRFTVGTSTAGWTEADCDFLCDGVDDQVEINQALLAVSSTAEGGETVLLDGEYHITGQITFAARSVLRGNGKNTVLYRDAVSMSDSASFQNAMIVLRNGCGLHNLVLDSTVDAPDSTQVYGDSSPVISDVSINTRAWLDLPGEHHVGTGIYVLFLFGNSSITNCAFGNLSTAIHLGNAGEGLITGCSAPFVKSAGSGTWEFAPCFLQIDNGAKCIIVTDNMCGLSSIKVNSNNYGNVISNNVASKIEITNTGLQDFPSNGGNIISGNILGGKEAVEAGISPGITLGENTRDWFVTGNQVRNVTQEDGYFPIIDNGVNNIIRFNSNDPGGSTPATVQQATPTVVVNADGTVTASATQAAGYVAAGTRSTTHQISSADDTDLTPENIKDGVSIFGVQGTLQSEGSGTAGVSSFNGRSGAVVPGDNDYTAAMVGAVSSPTVTDIQAVTQAEYDALETKNPSVLYLIKE